MKHRFFLFFIITTTLLYPYENITISGTIIDINNNPIHNVNIYSDRVGVSTNEVGSFTLTCISDEIITISHISYSDIVLKAKDIPNLIIMKSRNINSDEIIIRGDVTEGSLKETNNSLMVIQSKDIQENYTHFEDIINLVPNLNFSGGTSRPRYFQIRGIGELSQFSGEGPPHFSVGFTMDNIDFSGIGMVGLLNDINQIEVFKGPQSSIYGSNALGGLINISSNDPTPYKEGKFSIDIGDNQHLGLSGFYSLPITKKLYSRISLSKNQLDGFRKNLFLNRTDTNKKNEFTFRSKLFYSHSNSLSFKLTYMMIDIQNGYDVWATDNNGFNTFTDYIGKDYQKVNATSLKTIYKLTNSIKLNSITSFSQNNIVYNYDGDWGNDIYWKNNYDWYAESDSYNFSDPIFGGWGYYSYMFTDETTRKRNNISQEFRIITENTIGGIYISQTDEDDIRNGFLMGGNVDNLDSYFKLLNISAYTSYKWNFKKNLSFLTRLRIEKNQINSKITTTFYGTDSGDFNKKITSFHWGGKLGLKAALNDFTDLAFSISKGYKTNGVNQSINIGNPSYPLPDSLRSYKGEDAYNLEISYSYKDLTKWVSLNSFYLKRINPQVRLSYQLDPTNPTSFDFYTINALEGYVYGFEGQFKIMISDNIYFYDSFAILKSHISKYEFLGNTIGNRTQAHAPEFSASGGLEYISSTGVFIRCDHSIMLDFYHEDQYDSKTKPYQILNTSFGWKNNALEVSLWVKNLLNEKYVTRGMNFALEPTPNQSPYFFSKTYLSYGDPRHIGATLTYSF